MNSSLGFPKNKILAALPAQEYARLIPHLEKVPMRHDQTIYDAGVPMRYAYFPEDGLISLMNSLKDGSSVELSLVGRRGVLGIYLALGDKTSSHRAVVQIDGTALRIKAGPFVSEFKRSGAFQRLILSYIRCHLFSVSQHVACNRVHRLKERLARLILEIHDHFGESELAMTHESMAQLLGSPRSEVAKAAAVFRRAGFIDYRRREIKILDRQKLATAACECYSLLQQVYASAESKKRMPNRSVGPMTEIRDYRK